MNDWIRNKQLGENRQILGEEKEVTEDEMAGWYYQLNGHEFEQTWEIVKDREAWGAALHGVTKSDMT